MTRDNPLLFTKDGELSVGPLLLTLCAVCGLCALFFTGFGIFHLPAIAWGWFASFTTFCFIAGAAVDRARLIAASKTGSEVAEAVGKLPSELKDAFYHPDGAE